MSSVDDAMLERAVDLLRGGHAIGLPTETVYGLAADAENELAVREIFALKGRPSDHPLIVHLAAGAPLEGWAKNIPPAAYTLAERFWPGPLTMILERGPRAATVVTGGLPTIGLRVPGHAIAQQVLRTFGGGLAAPSANRFGRVSPTQASHVRQEFGERLLVLDGGACRVGIESTIVDLSSERIAILRPGAITAHEIEAAIGRPLTEAAANAPRVSGSLASHYAPAAGVELATAEQAVAKVTSLARSGRKVGLIAPHEMLGSLPTYDLVAIVPLAIASDPAGFARELYATLRQGDACGCDIVIVVPPLAEGIGIAVADRLKKSAAPRE